MQSRTIQVLAVIKSETQWSSFLQALKSLLNGNENHIKNRKETILDTGGTSTNIEFTSILPVAHIREVLRESSPEIVSVFCPLELQNLNDSGKRRRRRKKVY